MQGKEGVFIAIEGIDGAGKGTQFELLTNRLELAGYDIARFDFPRYDEPSSYFVKQYLNGEYGALNDVGPYTASLFYALDRFEAAKQVREALAEGKVVLANRFAGSSMAHQGTKFHNADERRGFFIWLDNLEFEMLHIPRPDINLVLRVPAEIAQSLVDQKGERAYTKQKRDIHEANIDHLRMAAEVYDDMCQLFPRDYVRIDCVRSGDMMPPETISNLVWEKLFPLLPKPSRPRRTAKAEVGASAVLTADPHELADGEAADTAATAQVQMNLTDIVTDTKGPVYAFTAALNPAAAAATLLYLQRSGSHPRDIALDELVQTLTKDNHLLQQLATASNEAAGQFLGVHMVTEEVSLLLATKLVEGRLAAYIEQPVRHLALDQKGQGGAYPYFTPKDLDPDTITQYRELLDSIFDTYCTLVERLVQYMRASSDTPKAAQDAAWQEAVRAKAMDAAEPVLPVATQTTIGMFASAQTLSSMIRRTLGDELAEARTLGQRLSTQARQVAGAFLEQEEQPERDAALLAYHTTTGATVKKIAAQYLPSNHADHAASSVDLADVWPRNELQLASDILYQHAGLPLRELQTIVDAWPYDKKAATLNAYIGKRGPHQRPGRVLEKAHYEWDILCDFGTFRDLRRHYHTFENVSWQPLTPRYGYDIPELVEEAGLTDMFEQCFDTSLELFSLLQQAGYTHEAQYATLLGHKLRWQAAYTAREAFRLHELSTGLHSRPATRALVQQMHEKLTEAHPLIGNAMRFVGTDSSDPPKSSSVQE